MPKAIDVTRFFEADSSYRKNRDEGFRRNLVEAFSVNFSGENGKHTGWSADIDIGAAAPGHRPSLGRVVERRGSHRLIVC